MKINNFLKDAGVLLIVVVMVLSTIAVTGATTYKNNAPEMQTTNDNDEIIFLEDFEYPKFNESDPDLIPPPGWDVTGSWGYTEDAYSGDFAIVCHTTEGTLQSPIIDLTPFNASYEPSLRIAYSLSFESYFQINYRLDSGAIATLDFIDYEGEGWMEKEWDITGFAGCELELWFIIGSYDVSRTLSPNGWVTYDQCQVVAYPIFPCADPVWVDDDFTSQTQGWGYSHFDNIKQGVMHCCPGGFVTVMPGFYQESNIVINKKLTIWGLDGLPGNGAANYDDEEDCNVNPGVGAPGIFEILSLGTGTYIRGLTIRNGYTGIRTGVYMGLTVGPSVDINYNYITGCECGIKLYKSSSSNIWDNEIIANDEYGIVLFKSNDDNIVWNNNIVDNGLPSILSGGGIRLDHSDNNNVNNNIISRNVPGGLLNWLSDYNKIYCNVIGSNHAQPHVTYHFFGIAGKGSYTEIFYNDICNNLDFGISWLCQGEGNVRYCNNLINHKWNAEDWNYYYPKNKWNGNFWSDFQSNSGYPLCYNIFGGGAFKDNSPLAHPCDHSTSCNNSGLILNKTANRSRVPIGEELKYIIYYENPNSYTIHNAVIIDYLPLNCHYIDAPTGTYHPYPEHWVIWEIGDLSPQKSGSVTLIVSVGDDVPEEIHNEVIMTSDETHAVWAYIDISSYDPGNNPFPPDIIGVTNGTKGEEYSYTIVSTDPNGDDIYYYIEWGDGQIEDWFGPYPSGETAIAKHIWEEQGTYTIRAKAKDTNGFESDWAELEVSMPRNRAINTPFLDFLQHYPILYQLFQRLLIL